MSSKVEPQIMQQHRDFAEVSTGLVIGLGLTFTLIAIFAVPLAGNLTGTRDFIEYWASGWQLVHHANPYDPYAVSALEHSAGGPSQTLIVMLNPPWTLPLVYPLGFFSFRVAAILWNLVLLACVLISARLIRLMHGSPPNHIHWLAFAFTPVILGLAMGQLSILALFGLVLFLRFHRHRPFLSGAALWFCALKPHLFLPFAAVLVAWIVVSRNYKLLAGTAAAIAITSAVAFLIDPTAWREYISIMRLPGLKDQFIPCLADAFRHWLDPQASWLHFVPAAATCVWALIYYWRHRSSWNWNANGSLLILISLVVAPYGWVYDQCCALPAILHGAYVTHNRKHLAALALLILLADIQLSAITSISPLSSPLWLWAAPAWLVWFLCVRPSRLQTVATPVATV
jgi:Glycosyltransferase family 87